MFNQVRRRLGVSSVRCSVARGRSSNTAFPRGSVQERSFCLVPKPDFTQPMTSCLLGSSHDVVWRSPEQVGLCSSRLPFSLVLSRERFPIVRQIPLVRLLLETTVLLEPTIISVPSTATIVLVPLFHYFHLLCWNLSWSWVFLPVVTRPVNDVWVSWLFPASVISKPRIPLDPAVYLCLH